MTDNLHYYLSTGDKYGFYTLRRMYEVTINDPVDGPYTVTRDTYVRNLSTDWTKAVEKAVKYSHGRPIYGTDDKFELTPFTRGAALWQFTLDTFNYTMPFGKLMGLDIRSLDWNEHGEYLQWFACYLLGRDKSRAENYRGICAGVAILVHFADEIEAGKKAAEEKKRTEEESKTPVIEGRIEIEGEIVKHEWKDNPFAYNSSRHVMTVKDDRGFLVWGTVPSSLDVSKGDRVHFVATVTKSDRDESFGFFKRPMKAKIIEEEVA